MPKRGINSRVDLASLLKKEEFNSGAKLKSDAKIESRI